MVNGLTSRSAIGLGEVVLRKKGEKEGMLKLKPV